ncbi:MAG: hypothetical protein GF418_07030 [Chitinivibrionales bacterium]|nr:hypothetical protein [Chitinivibrionales bacterium]MBD3395364.1 hypothetical protein [Chitinivibrionales bacterium]
MKSRKLATTLLCALLAAGAAGAETMLSLKMGPAWPKELRENNTEEGITAWEPSLEIGALFDQIVGIGLDLEFQWKRRVDDSTYTDNSTTPPTTVTAVDKVERFFMFPPSFYLLVDPVPHLIVHPVIKGQIGMTLLYYSNKWFEDGDEKKSPDTGLYYGVYGKAGADALYDLGETASVFVGFEFQFGNARHKKDDSENEYYRKQIYGPGIRMGFRFLM